MMALFKKNSFILLCVLLIAFMAFSPALKGKFSLWDDNVHLTENVALRALDGEHLVDIFTQRVNAIYIPLTTLSFAIEYRFFELNPFPYYLNNLLMHLTIVFLIHVLILRLGFSQCVALIAAAIFVLHPTRVESVAWITERKDVLYAFFYVLSLLAYTRYVSTAKIKSQIIYLILAVMLGVLSILAKPMAVSLPLIFILIDWYLGRGINTKTILEKIPAFILIVGICIWGTYSQHVRVPIAEDANLVLVWLWTFSYYIVHFFVPLTVVPIYKMPQPVTLLSPQFVTALGVFLVTCFIVFRLRKNRAFIFAFLLYVLSMFFLWRTDANDTNIVASRFMYLPSLGFCLMIGLSAEWLWERLNTNAILKWGAVGALIGYLFILSIATFQMSKLWTDPIALWKYQIAKFPTAHIGYTNLAVALGKTEEYQKAQEEYKKAFKIANEGYEIDKQKVSDSFEKVQYLMNLYKKTIELDPQYALGLYNLGSFYHELGMLKEAQEYYKKVIDIDAKFKDAFYNWAGLLGELGQTELSIKAFKENVAIFKDNPDVYINVFLALNEAVEEYPQHKNMYVKAREETIDAFIKFINDSNPKANHYFNLGFLYQEMGDQTRAVSAYQKALEIHPLHENTLYNLGNLYREMGKFDEALVSYENVIKANPHKTDAYLNIGTIYVRLNKLNQAKVYFKKAAQVGGGSSKAYFNLAYLEDSDGKFEDAERLYLKSIERDFKNAESYYNLGNLYARLKQTDKAIDQFKKAVEVNASHMDAWVNLSVLSFQLKDYKQAARALDEAILLGYQAPQDYVKALEGY